MPEPMSKRLQLDDPGLRPFLPMVYVAWADGDLSGDELTQICGSLDEPCQSVLGSWLDPTQPPSASQLQQILAIIRRDGGSLSSREKLDLTGLGLRLAQASGGVSQVERGALEQLEEALGIAGTEAARQLLTTRRPAKRQRRPDAGFDVEILRQLLAEPKPEIRQRVFELLAEPEFEYQPGRDKETYRRQTLAWCQRLADAGIGGLSFPKSVGGEDDMLAFISAFAALCHFDLSLVVKAGVQFGLFGGSILNLGTERHHLEYLPACASLELPGCFAMTETGHGSNVADLETTATYDAESDELVIHTPHHGARKDYIGNAARDGRMATVFAQLEVAGEVHGVHAILVPIRDPEGHALPGVYIGDDGVKMGLNGVDNGRLGFDQVRVPRANLLDRFATIDEHGNYSSQIASPNKRFFTMLGTLVGGRVSVALGALRATQSAMTIAIRYAVRRRQFGPGGEPEIRLIDYQTHQRRLMPRLATSYALHFALERLGVMYAESDPLERREVEAAAAGLKAFSTWHATDTIQTCRECCGGQGYLAANRFAALKADTDVFTTFEGDNIVLLQLLAKSLLAGYKRQFSDLNPLGLMRLVAKQVTTRVTQRNPVTTRLVLDEHLRDREFHHAAFRWREDHLVATVARRLKKRLDAGVEPSDAMLACQEHLVRAAEAHVERRILEHFADAIERCQDDGVKAILAQICDLFALHRLEVGSAFFLEQGYFEGGKAKAIRSLVIRLCAELAPRAIHLVDAFGIPDKLIGAPIAK